MANRALFMNPNDTVLGGYLESNYDQDQVASVTYDQQQIEIKPLIGSGLYDEIEGQINNNTLTSLNSTLLDLIKDALRMYVLSDGAMTFTYKFRNKGVVTMSSENSQPADLTSIIQLTQRFKDKAQVYAQRVTDYLCENSSSYPLYHNPGSGIDVIHPKNNNYSTGWYMGDIEPRQYLDEPSQ